MKSYSFDLVSRIVNHYKTTNDSLRKTAQIYQVGKSSIYRWIKNSPISIKVPIKPKKSKIDRIRDWIKTQITTNPWYRLKDLSKKVRDQYGIIISTASLSRWLKKENISYKKMKKFTSIQKNSPTKKEQFKKSIRTEGLNKILSFDEVGFQLEMYPLKGWSTKGTKCHYKTSKGRRNNYTGSFLISSSGIIHWSISKQAMNIDGMLNFLNQLDKNLVKNKIVVMDNLKVHHNIKVKTKMKRLGMDVRWIPPYSPELNPVEEMFSWIKRKLRYEIIQSETQLKEHLDRLVSEINQSGLMGYFLHAYGE